MRVAADRDERLSLVAELAQGSDSATAVRASAPITVTLQAHNPVRVRLALTGTGGLAARSCTALNLIVKASLAGGPSSKYSAFSRPLAVGGTCGRDAPISSSAALHKPGRPPTDPMQQTELAFGMRSHWLQPWRAYSDTLPVSSLLDAVGINLNVTPEQLKATARLLATDGIRRVRVEVPWGAMSFQRPDQLQDPQTVSREFQVLRDYHLRPLVLLNANSGAPGPLSSSSLRVVAPAPAQARTINLDPSSARQVIPGKTGLDQIGAPRSPDVLITQVASDGRATLAEPLPRPLAAGDYMSTTLRYAPFAPPLLPDGSANPQFEATLTGWLSYVKAVTRSVRSALGNDDFDVEIWNELSFGSDFLNAATYENPPPAARGDVTAALLARTTAWLRDPAHGVSHVGIGDGFSNQTPFVAGSTVPKGVTALDKHPYSGLARFPAAQSRNTQQAIDAQGQPAGGFVPNYVAFFPEYYLNALQTEHLVRDLSPVSSTVSGVVHGRSAHPPGGSAPTMWITEFNEDPTGADASDPTSTGHNVGGLSQADIHHLQAKTVLRTLVSYVNKGVTAVDFYAAEGPRFGLVSDRFFAATASAKGAYPGGTLAGETMDSISRMTGALQGFGPIDHPRSVRLDSVEDPGNRTQFAGDGTPRHPALYDRDVLGFFPFQLDDHAWVAPVYVMTRDIATLYRRDLPPADETRFDLPNEPFRITIAGVDGVHARVSLYDPLSGEFAPVRVAGRQASKVVVDIDATDSPRMLFIDDGA